MIMKRIALTVCAAAAVVAAAQPAMAVDWASKTSPLKGGGGAQGYGNYFDNQNINAANASMRRDSNGGGGIYVDTKFTFYYDNGSSADYWQHGSAQTARTGSKDWQYKSVTSALHSRGTSSRGKIKVCEDRNWAPDGCSEEAIPTFSY